MAGRVVGVGVVDRYGGPGVFISALALPVGFSGSGRLDVGCWLRVPYPAPGITIRPS